MLFNTSPAVAPSGRGIYFPFPRAVSSLALPGEHQQLKISVRPTNVTLTNFTLTFNGQTTVPISIKKIPPPVYFQWNQTVTAGTYDLAVNIWDGATGTPNAVYEIFDNGIKIGQTILNMALNGAYGGPTNPTPFSDPVLKTYNLGAGDGPAVQWYPLGRFTFSSTNISVRVSCDVYSNPNEYRNTVWVNDLRIATTDGNTVIRVQDTRPPAVAETIPSIRINQSPFFPQVFGDEDWINFDGVLAGERYGVDPAEVQAALQNLSNIGAGNITCANNGTVGSPLDIMFVNQLDNLAQNLITSSDSNVVVTRYTAGGIWPKIKINGGSPIRLNNPYWYTLSPQVSAIYFALIADMKDTTYQSFATYSSVVVGNWQYSWDLFPGNVGYNATGKHADLIGVSASQNATMTYSENPVTQGQYRISATWPHDSRLSTDVTYTLTDAKNNVLATHHVNQTLAPSGSDGFEVIGTATLTDLLTNGLIVVQSNNTNLPMISDTVRFERTSAHIEVKINQGDTVTYSSGNGWITTLDGPVSGVTDAPLQNLVGPTNSLFPSTPSGAQTMKIGYNTHMNTNATGALIYANLLHATGGLDGIEFDSDGYPTKVHGYRSNSVIYSGSTAIEADRKSWPGITPGEYVLMWDGQSNADLTYFSSRDTYVENTSKAVITGGLNNKRFFNVTTDAGYGCTMAMNLYITGTNPDGTGIIDARNIRIYSTTLDINNPPKYQPKYLEGIQGMKTLRFLDPLGTITGSPANFSDYNFPDTKVGRGNPVRISSSNIAKIEAYTGTDYTFITNHGVPFLFTTVGNHQFSTGQTLQINRYVGPNAIINQSSGGTTEFNFDGMINGVFYVSPTQFVLYGGPLNCTNMTNTITNPGGTADVQVQCGRFADLVELCNYAGADFYLNTATSTTDACVTAMAEYLVANLNAGLKVHLEFSNELWNFFVFPAYFCATATHALGYAPVPDYPVPYQCHKSLQHWTLMETVFAAHGRSADFHRVMGGQHSYGGRATTIAQYCSSQNPKITFDELAVAPYYQNGPNAYIPNDTTFADLEDMFTADQQLDVNEMFWMHGGYENEMVIQKNALAVDSDSSSPFSQSNTIKIIGYEGGPEGTIRHGRINARSGERTHAVLKDPRYWNLLVNSFKIYQDSGLYLLNIFTYSGTEQNNNDSKNVFCWPSRQGTNQNSYMPGDANQDAIQINTPDRLDIANSVVGGAVTKWAQLYNTSSVSMDFSIARTGSGTLTRSSTLTNTITLTEINSYVGTANLTISGLPTGVTAAFSPTSLSNTVLTSTLTFTANSSATLGGFIATITATDATNSLTHTTTANINLVQNSVPDFTLTSSGDVIVPQMGSGVVTVSLNTIFGYSQVVNLSVSGLTTGITASFSNPTLSSTGSLSSGLTIFASNSAALGRTSITVTGTDSNLLTRSVSFNLTVNPPVVAATSYSLSVAHSYIDVGDQNVIYATLANGTTLTSPLTITLTDSAEAVIGSTIVINPGFTSGSTTIVPTPIVEEPAIYVHRITATHTGGGFTGQDGSTSFIVLGNVIGNAIANNNSFYVLPLGVKFDGATGHYIKF